MTHYIYALCEPDTGEPRYIGVSVNPVRRLAGHYEAPATKKLGDWITSLTAPASIKILGESEVREDALREESRLIDAFSRSGRLLNTANVHRSASAPLEVSGLGEMVRSLREELGLSGLELHRRSGVKQPTISCIESGRQHDIMGSSLISLARVLGVSAEYLLTGTQS